MDVAVSLYLGCLGTLPEKLQVLANECSNFVAVPKQLSLLKEELIAMHAFLLKVAAMEKEGHVDIQLKAWASEVREISYDVEDCVDEFTRSLRIARGRQQRDGGMAKKFFIKCAEFLLTIRARHQFADKIEALKARVVEASERRERYKIDELPCCSSDQIDPRLSALFIEDKQLVGIERPRDELMRWLIGAEGGLATHLRVLSIVGFGGLGKTTLARQLSNNIRGDFFYNVFVSVSQKPNLRNILRGFLCQLPQDNQISGDMDSWDEARMITEIRVYLLDKRYLVVIDDVWSVAAWESIRCAFPENHCSSRMIITTRISDVAQSCCLSLDGRVYQMDPLSFHNSKQLFLRRIFGFGECPDGIEEISDDILKKCGGIPLAIVSISGMLAIKPAVKIEWEKVRNSISSALEKDRSLEGLNSILMLSYFDLPHSLRTCFLYLSVFPEDCNIEKDQLVRRWISENFIAEERGRTLQEIGESYFDELINRSMIQPTDIDSDGKACGCVVHDIMLELIITKAAEENFVSILGCQGFVSKPQGSIRRLSIQQAQQEAMSGLQGKVSHVRTVGAYGLVKNLPRLEEFQCLRVLDFEGCLDLDLYDFSKIESITQLKYLSLRNAFMISQVPSGVVKLFNLEFLDLRGTQIIELPAGIIHLTELKQLLTGDVDQGLTKLPEGIGNMKSLQVLLGFNIMRSSIASVLDLGNLINLKELSVQFNTTGHDQIRRHEDALLSSLCNLGRHLQSLWIRSIDSSFLEFLNSWSPVISLHRFQMSTNYFFLKIPRWVAQLNSLQYININIVEVTEADLCVLGELSSLICLHLWFKEDPKERIIFRCGGFKSLKTFHYVRHLYIARGEGYLVFENGALPKLERLSVPFSVSMAKGHDFYLGIVHLKSLKYAKVILGKESATPCEAKTAAESIRKEASSNPNHPNLIIEGEEH